MNAMGQGGIYAARDFFPSTYHSSTGTGSDVGAPAVKRGIAGFGSPPRLGRFDLIELLGRGGMGAVYRATDRAAGRGVALKVAHAKQEDAQRLARFQREGEVTASLDHPGIVRVHSAGDREGLAYIAYELVENAETLEEAFASRDLVNRTGLVLEAARALGYAHGKGVVHRDVKPENILVDREGRVRVADFGLAYAQGVERLTRSGAFLGTPLFMSPELFSGKGKDAGPQSDVWSLGVILYVALCGELPFDGESLVELSVAVMESRPKRPRRHDRGIPRKLEAVCLRALSREPQARYADGEAFADDLDAALSGASISARTVRLWPVAAVAALILVAVGIFMGVSGDRPAADAADSQTPESPKTLLPASPQVVQFAAAVRLAVERGDDAGLRKLLAKAPPLRGTAEVAGLRAFALEFGSGLLGEGRIRGLRPVFTLLGVVNPLVDEPADPAFADAVMAHALALDQQASQRLGDARTVTLVEELAKVGLRPNPKSLLLLLDGYLGLADVRRPAAEFPRRIYSLLVAATRLEVVVASEHLRMAPPWTTLRGNARARNPVERLVQLALDLASSEEQTDEQALSDLEALLQEHSLTPRLRARALTLSAIYSGRPKAERLKRCAQAIALDPDDLTSHVAAARYSLMEGVRLIQAEQMDAARRTLERGRAYAEGGLSIAARFGYDDQASMQIGSFVVRKFAVTHNVFLWRDAEARRLIDELSEREGQAARVKSLEGEFMEAIRFREKHELTKAWR